MKIEEIIDQNIEALTNKNLNQALLDSLPYPAILIRKDRRIVASNKIASEIGAELETHCWDTLGKRASISDSNRTYYETHKCVPEGGFKCIFCMCDKAFDTSMTINEQVTVGDSSFNTYWVPLGDGILLHYFIEIVK